MTSLDKGDGSMGGQAAGGEGNHQALVDRLNERHAQVKAAQLRRIHERDQQRKHISQSTSGGSEKNLNFLQQFLITKTAVLADLDAAAVRLAEKTITTSGLTQLLDDIAARVEGLQQSMNDASLYLTSFDSEQSRLELKSLNSQFQTKRAELLPTRKFTFTRKPAKKEATAVDAVDSSRPPVLSPAPNTTQPISLFDPAYSLVDLHGPDLTLCLPKPNQTGPTASLTGQSVYLANLTKCIVHVNGVCGNLIARNLRDCRVYIYPVAGSIWLEDCDTCDFVLACRQLRVHRTQHCRLALHAGSRPIIEHSSALRVGPYALCYPELDTHLELAGLSKDVNLCREVEDFSHPNKRLTTGSPNWSVLADVEWNDIAAAAASTKT